LPSYTLHAPDSTTAVCVVPLGIEVALAAAIDARLVAAGGVYCTTEEEIAEREELASAALEACTLTVVVV